MPLLYLLILMGLFQVSEAFAAGKQLTGQHAPATSSALVPAEAQKAFQLHDGFEARLFAAEPDVVNPVAMTFDDRGRLWVVELYEYPLGAAPGTKPRDQIKILEDTDNDGRADKVTVFADGLNLATGILYGDGGVYVGQAPHLLFLQDTNGDDVADKRTVLLTGFGLQDRHELLNGFTWGPDGQLYMTHGVFTSSKVRIPEASDDGVVMNAAVARFDPVSKRFEIYADGTSNPWGVDFDQWGNAFVSACVIDHLFHMAAGGIYVRQGGVPGNPYAYELLPSIVDHKHHMAAYAGICVYQGDQFPDEYRGRVFMGNIHQNALNHDRLIPNGSSFKAVAEKDFLTTTDGWFRPVSEQTGPDGALWIADWYDKYPCYQNANADPEGVDRAHGRIWRVVYTGKETGKKIGSRPEASLDLAREKNEQLIALLKHRNSWHRRTAQRILMERARIRPLDSLGSGPDSLPNLMDSGTNSIETRMSAFWVLAEHNRDSDGIPKWLLYDTNSRSDGDAQLVHSILGARHFGNNRDASPYALKALHQLASDPDPRVRLAVATACRQLVAGSLTMDNDIREVPIGEVLTTLIRASSDAKDPLIPFMIWMASEPLFAVNPEPGLRWLAENGSGTMPLSGILARKAMRRICDTGDMTKVDMAVRFLAAIWQKGDALVIETLDGLIAGQKGKPVLPSFDTGPHIAEGLRTASAPVKERLQQLASLWGDATAVAQSIDTIRNAASTEERFQAIQAVKQNKSDAVREVMLELVRKESNERLTIEAFRVLGGLGGDSVASVILQSWPRFNPTMRRAAADVLASRWNWADAFLNAVETKAVRATDVPASVIRSILNYKDPNFTARAERLLGKYRDSDADKLKVIRAKREIALKGEPDLKRGHEIATKSCFVCHQFFGEGAEVGPDLTGVGRSTLDALLANVIDPNQIIGGGYENVMIETKDGRSVSGRMIENSDARVRLLGAGPVEHVVAKSDIESMKVSELSVMPEGLEQMPDEDFRDLIWFILTPPQEGGFSTTKRDALSAKP